MDVIAAMGTTFEPERFVLGERLSVVNFARALDLDDPILTSAAEARRHGYNGRPVTPPMYAFFQTLPLEELEGRLAFTWGRTLGAGMDFQAGVVAGEEDEIVGQSVVEGAWEAVSRSGATNQFLRLRTDFTRADGAIACRWRALFLERKDGQPDPMAPTSESTSGSGAVMPVAHAAEWGPAIDATPGQGLPSHTLSGIDRLRLARISIAIDNPDPLHIDDDVARAAGFPTVIGQGSGATGLLYEPVRRWAGIERVVGGAVRLAAPYSLGAQLTASGTVSAIEEIDGQRYADCKTMLRDGSGDEIATAQLRVLVS